MIFRAAESQTSKSSPSLTRQPVLLFKSFNKLCRVFCVDVLIVVVQLINYALTL